MKKHPRYRYLIIKPQNDTIAEIIFAHHERYDGKGYPNGLSGDSIPFLARIIAVADSIDAMSSDRCYRKALPWATCISEIDRNNGIMYDPDVVNAFHLSIRAQKTTSDEVTMFLVTQSGGDECALTESNYSELLLSFSFSIFTFWPFWFFYSLLSDIFF